MQNWSFPQFDLAVSGFDLAFTDEKCETAGRIQVAFIDEKSETAERTQVACPVFASL